MKKIFTYIILILFIQTKIYSQLKVGSNPKTITANSIFEVESTSGSKIIIRKDTAMMGINNSNPNNKLEITHGTSGNSGLRFTNLTNANNAKSANSVNQKFLSVNSLGDVVLANSVDQLITVTGLSSSLSSPVAAATFQAGVFEDNYSKIDSEVVYVNQTDGTQWIYSASNGGQYKSYSAPASTEWYTAGSTIDAGNNKTGSIYRKGNVGIGVSPVVNLHVNNSLSATATVNADAQILRLSRPTTAGVKWSNLAQFNLGSYSASPTVATSAASRLDLAMNDSNSLSTTNIMTWLANGNVGIGTVNPLEKLHTTGNLYQSTAASYIQKNLGNTFGWIWSDYFYGGDQINYSFNYHSVGGSFVKNSGYGTNTMSQNNAGFFFKTSNGVNGAAPNTTAMVITNAAKVGIGTTAPNSPLTVSGPGTTGASTAAQIFVKDTGTGNALVGFQVQGVRLGWFGMDRTSASMYWCNDGAGNQNALSNAMLVLTVGGNYGIGTSAPTAKLSVNGTANNTTGTWAVFSDIRSKENVKEYNRGLKEVLLLKPVTFNYIEKSNLDKNTHVGFIAQEVQKIMPEMVQNIGKVGEIDNFLQITQEGYVQMLVNAVKEQQEIIEKQAAKLESLENKFLELERKLK